jgi:DNA replication protein DnaC
VTAQSTPSISKPEFCTHGNIKKFCHKCRIEENPDHPLCKHGIKVGLTCVECKKVENEQWMREETEKAEREQRTLEEREAKRKKDRIENTGDYLHRMNVPTRYLELRLENYYGNEKLVEIIRNIPLAESILFTGHTGCGKTHLSVARMADIVKADIPGKKSFCTAPDLLMQIRASFSAPRPDNPIDSIWNQRDPVTEEEIVSFYSELDFLIIDDLGAEKSTEFSITTLYIILDRRIRELKTTIITTNLNMNQIEEHLGARIASRLSEMKNIKINMPDYRKKR